MTFDFKATRGTCRKGRKEIIPLILTCHVQKSVFAAPEPAKVACAFWTILKTCMGRLYKVEQGVAAHESQSLSAAGRRGSFLPEAPMDTH